MRYEVLRLITSTAFASNAKSSGTIFSEGFTGAAGAAGCGGGCWY
jgi:hypothetical protein